MERIDITADSFFSSFGISVLSVIDQEILFIEIDNNRYLIMGGDDIDTFKKILTAYFESKTMESH